MASTNAEFAETSSVRTSKSIKTGNSRILEGFPARDAKMRAAKLMEVQWAALTERWGSAAIR